MTGRLEKLFGRSRGQRRWRFGAMIAAVIVVPLAVAGFFAGALTGADSRIGSIPAVIVNNDKMVTTTAADGSKQPILAGRQLVTELTGPKSQGFRWSLSNTEKAKQALADGDAYAVLTIPKGFSASIASISTAQPRQANLAIKTDDAHGYLAGTAAQAVGGAMSSAFGSQITQRYIAGLLGGMAGTGQSLGQAADSATTIGQGVGTLASGLDQLSTGAGSLATGASQLSDGVSSYTDGVSSLSGGLSRLSEGTAGLGQLGGGAAAYVNGTAQLSAALAQASAGLQSADPAVVEQSKATVIALSQKLQGATAAAPQLASGLSSLGSVHDGIAQSANGAGQLADGSDALTSGASSLANGATGLQQGAASSAAGAKQLADGTAKLAAGLGQGAKAAKAATTADADSVAKIVANPVTVTNQRANKIDAVGPIIGMLAVPIALWIGAIVTILLWRPITRSALASTASSLRLVARSYARAAGLALAQAAGLVVLLHTALGAPVTALPATAAFAVLLALVFTAIHHLLVTALGRVGVVVSIVLLGLQLAAVPGLLPGQLLSAPFRAVTGALPLTFAVDGMQAIVSGVGGAAVAGPAVLLALIGALALACSWWAVAARRGARSFGFVPVRGGA